MIKLATINKVLSLFGILLIVQHPVDDGDDPVVFFIETVRSFEKRAGKAIRYYEGNE